MRLLKIMTLCAATLALAPQAFALQSGDQFKQWAAECETRDDGSNACHIFQNLVLSTDASEQQVMRVSIGYPEGSDQPVAVFLMPLGIWLPRGMTLAVDENEPQTFPILVCGSRGCQTTLELQPDMLQTLQKGKQLVVLLFNANQQPVRIPVDLSGITKGMKALK